jgi:amino acid adenylation domain-containing protein
VPLDPEYPTERLQYMLEDSGPVALLTQRHLEERFSSIGDGVPVVNLNATAAWQSFPESNPEADAVGLNSRHLAYVIYTSGSTGQPKGVMVEHRGLCNINLTQSRELKVEPSSRILQFASFSFDVSVWDTILSLCQGAALYLLPQNRLVAGDNLIETVERDGITHALLPPTLLAGLSERANVAALPVLMAGGEALPGWIAERWGRERQLINVYGPTETTIVVTMHRCAAEERGNPSIGRPITNTRVYILDSNREPVPVGVVGEIYIGGAGVARGYLKRPDLTAERFVLEPYAKEPGARMYRTGDLARWLPNGNIEFLGRNDHQVKIRGFRIELGEIEARLAEHPEVLDAVVLAREDTPGEKRLVAYVVANQKAKEADSGNKNAGLWISELREHLLGKLPEYMVPTAYVPLKRIPLTPNGKIDRKSLPEPDKDIREQEYVGPRNATEETLCRLWQEVLRRERVGIHDNFFNIGGHSLLAVQVISCIKQAFTVEMPLSVLFAAPTVARMGEHIAAVNEPDRSQSSPVLVNIQPHGSRPPFFCVHAVGGQVISYAELSQELGLEQPFYGLQSPPANYFPESGVSIEQLAALYNREIRSVQPVGPYLLSGWSMGGLVAWEMAQQLMKEGETISLLALIDTAPPPKYREADDRADEISMLARFAVHMSRLIGKNPQPLAQQFLLLTPQDQWKMVQETLISYGVLAPKTAHAEMTALLNVFTRNFRAMNNYSIQTSKQAVVYFRSSETPERFSKVWTKWSGGGIQFHSVPGDHFTMLRRPGVRIIADTLQPYISANNNNLYQRTATTSRGL